MSRRRKQQTRTYSKKPYNDIDYKTSLKFEKLAKDQGVSKVARGEKGSNVTQGGFFSELKKALQNKKTLQQFYNQPVKPGSKQTWGQRRNNFCSRHGSQQTQQNSPLLQSNNKYNGTPSRRQLGMLMWLCSNLSQQELNNIILSHRL